MISITHDYLIDLQVEIRDYRKALKEITEGKGRFSQDQLTHASNTIEDMKHLAQSALNQYEADHKDEEVTNES